MTPKLYCGAVKYEKVWIQGFVRETSYDDPAFVALDFNSGNEAVVWYAKDDMNILSIHGNIRTEPLVNDNTIVFGSPCSKSIVGIDAQSGNTSWQTPLGIEMFPHWTRPVLTGNGIALARHDGYVYEIDRADHRKKWSLFLGAHQFAGIQEQVIDLDVGEQRRVSWSKNGNWKPRLGRPIFSTPALDDESKALFVGTDEGYLYKLDMNSPLEALDQPISE